MEAHAIPHLREIVVFLMTAGIAVPLLHHLRISPVLGYLIIGGIVGPYGLGLFATDFPWLEYAVITDLKGVQALAELGVIFLLFMIGLELSLDRLWAMRKLVFGLGSLQILITATVIGLVAREFGNTPGASVVLGACLALSSTAIVMQLLVERRELASPLGRSSFSILLMQDLAVVPILFIVGVLGAKTGGDLGMSLAMALGKAAAVIVAIYLGGRLILRPMLSMVTRSGNAEMFMAATLLTIVVASSITGATGLSMALGAFLAGLLLAETEFRHQIEVDIEPFKGLLLGLFFMSVGMGIDYRVVADAFGWIVASVIGLFVIKSVITAGLCIAFGLPRHTSLEAGLLLGQGGEFAFVVVGLAMSLGLIPTDVAQFMLIVTGMTMVVTPLVASTASRLSSRLTSASTQQTEEGNLESLGPIQGHVLIAGFGRIGRLLARTLDADNIPYVALDTSAKHVADARADGLPVFFGNASRLELLRRANAENASMLVLTMDNPNAVEHVVEVVRAEWPQLPVLARARDARHAARLLALGATEVVPETLEASLQLAGRVLSLTGAPEDVVHRRLELQRGQELNSLKAAE
ncbi:cation:proton antiporter [Thauera sp. CAU 1555]|uniref:Cation:proton antiporter n=1 Tax=Thauera sedimentorum TaxID=2767595 RepID=A0ABR9B864_9RHOO|nr:monovalent cation:proton antiporter-2 (CPA2) family protein [Thauera sedimentorum]MBC9071195.1 cation:proton antiporter [Thauera sedimentorum]MBD8502114.1 cation:proton antiporter [Thauera sedimentorum]